MPDLIGVITMRKAIIILAILTCANQPIHAQTRIVRGLISITEEKLSNREMVINVLNESRGKKSVTLAVLSSLLIPGLGELYAGSFTTGKYYSMAEGGLWLTYAGFRLHANWLRNDARSFAEEHSGVTLNGKDEQFEVNIGNFNTVDDYNQAKLRNREYEFLYTDIQYTWRWDSDVNRAQFKNLRIRSDQIFNNSKFIIAAVVINHILSAFSAGRAATAYNRTLSSDEKIEIQSFALNDGFRLNGVGLMLTAKF